MLKDSLVNFTDLSVNKYLIFYKVFLLISNYFGLWYWIDYLFWKIYNFFYEFNFKIFLKFNEFELLCIPINLKISRVLFAIFIIYLSIF